MPEMPEIENYKNELDSVTNTTIEGVVFSENSRVFKEDKNHFLDNVLNKKITSIERYGKYLLLNLSNNESITFHFGMTGKIKIYAGSTKPEHTELVLRLSNEKSLVFICIRKLGKIWLKTKQELIKEKNLGPDVLNVSENDFVKIMNSRRGMIKTSLMSQSQVAGLGNVYVDEILFQVGIHPKTKSKKLNGADFKKIYKTMKKVLHKVVEKNANRKKLPKKYLTPIREKNNNCPKCKGKIKKIRVGGRPTYYCNNHQQRTKQKKL